jgi:hypothetical protein
MSEFDPSAPAMVHDRLNDRTFEWKPEWRAAYEKHAARHAPGVIEFDGPAAGRMELRHALNSQPKSPRSQCRGFSMYRSKAPDAR